MKHIHCDIIKAWADGAQIQCYNEVDKNWKTVEDPRWSKYCDYRIKPEVKKYRVALFQTSLEIYTISINFLQQEKSFERHTGFIKWLTDWIEYEFETSTETGK